MLFQVRRRGVTGDLLENAVKTGLGIEPAVKSHRQQGVLLILWFGKAALHFFYAVAIYKVKEVFAQLLIDDL